ncbi:MAG: peptide MFS transporter [Acidobacteria bacterium]|nr:peptide MFS transporter [Acidobacteriota bacterium]
MATYVPDAELETGRDTSGLGGHPKGLTTLFFTEMWERFSFYGMRAILLLYMVNALGFNNAKATAIYGTYTGSVYLLSVPGGWIADNLLGARNAVLIGGIVIALGHFSMAVPSLATFFLGLILISLGTGLLKPNISTMVGGLYSENDARRDAGFSIFYMGINIGAFLSPLVCGFLAQSDTFKSFLSKIGVAPDSSWHWGFAAAGVGMTLGLVQYVWGANRLKEVGKKAKQETEVLPAGATSMASLIATHPQAKRWQTAAYLFRFVAVGFLAFALLRIVLYVQGKAYGLSPAEAFIWVYPAAFFALFAVSAKYFAGVIAVGEAERAAQETKRLAVIGILFAFTVLFWMAFEQAGSSLTLFADKMTRNRLFSYEFPSSWFQSVNSLFIIAFAPVFSWVWLRRQNRWPSSPMKFALGLIFAGLGFVVVAYAASLASGSKVSPMWLVLVYLLHTIGELCLSPVGLSTMTKLAPTKLVGLMMGVWFLATSLGNYAGGMVAGFFDASSEAAVVRLFMYVALTTMIAGGILALLSPYIRKMMGRVN